MAHGDDRSRVVYLNFSDGTEGVTLGSEDDATKNVSRLCAAAAFSPWRGAMECGDRDSCRERIRRLVTEYYHAYPVRFTTVRPAPGTAYTMVVIAPPNEFCTFGRRGMAFADCQDKNSSNIAFVFDCSGHASACAVMVAHELGHSFGLVHSLDETDIMNGAPEDPRLRFRKAASAVAENQCGVTMQSSHDVLLKTLGATRQR